jgi:hypothetical protein
LKLIKIGVRSFYSFIKRLLIIRGITDPNTK